MAIHDSATTTRFLVERPILTITGPVTFNASHAAALLEEFPEAERYEECRRLLELGAQAAGVLTTSTTLRLVEAQLAAMAQEMTAALTGLLTSDRATAQLAITELLNEHRAKLTAGLKRYLDPESQASLPAAMAKVFDAATGNLLKQVKVLLSDGDEGALAKLGDRFSKELAKATALIIEQIAARNALTTRSALAGRPYEDALEERLISLARPTGDRVLRCADSLGVARRRSGDLMVTISPEAVGGRDDLRIVVEAKRRSEATRPFTTAEIQRQLANARKNRAAGAGLFVTELASLLPLNLGFHEYSSTDFAVAWEAPGDDLALAVAYRLLRGSVIAGAHEEAGEPFDLDAYAQVVAELRTSMTRLETVRGQHQSAINSITRASTVVTEVHEAVLDNLRRLDALAGL